LPAGGKLTSSWGVQSGPGSAVFADATKPVTTATLGAIGAYVVALTANDGQLTTTGTAQITVFRANQPPVVNAGQNQSIQLPATATLAGTVQDDTIPPAPFVPPTLVIGWSMISGPGTVTFAAPSQAQTTASFSAPGVYVLRLTAIDDDWTSASDVTVTVSASAPVNQAPVVTAGPNQTTTQPFNTLTLNG